MNSNIVVLGGGPTGLGACTRLQQMGHKNWTLIDKNDYTGGLAGSFLDEKGFLWDVGGHVIFSHYKYFNDLIDQGVLAYAKHVKDRHEIQSQDIDNLDKLWNTHKRESWIRFTPESWISYPFQNNFYHLNNNQKLIQECMDGMLELTKLNNQSKKSTNFKELIDNLFGAGLAKHFMIPYNFKVWGYPAQMMNASWIGERVAMVDLAKILNDYIKYVSSLSEQKNVNMPKTEIGSWGPNSVFKYPKYGGTGGIWKGVGHLLDNKNFKLNTEIVEIDSEQKLIKFVNSNTIKYDKLISTIPIDILLQKVIKPTKLIDVEKLWSVHGKPKYSTTHVIGLGFDGPITEEIKDKSWMYFPSLDRSPFYRMTAFSNYSPYLVNRPGEQSSMMFEVCQTEHMPDTSDVVNKTIEGALNEKLMDELDVDRIVSKFHAKFDHGYPTPYLTRDPFLNDIEPVLRNQLDIYSRGR